MNTTKTRLRRPGPSNRRTAPEWIDGVQPPSRARGQRARAAGYIAETPDSMGMPAIDGEACTEFLGVFVEGFPGVHLEGADT